MDNPELNVAFVGATGAQAFTGTVGLFYADQNPVTQPDPVLSFGVESSARLVIPLAVLDSLFGFEPMAKRGALARVPASGFNLVARGIEKGGISWSLAYDPAEHKVYQNGSGILGDVTLSLHALAPMEISVSGLPENEAAEALFIPGTPFSAAMNAGGFSLEGIPQGYYPGKLQTNLGQIYDVGPIATKTANAVVVGGLEGSIGQETILDSALPGGKLCAPTVHLVSGRTSKEFHLTYEKNGGWYRHFNGKEWEDPIQVTSDSLFRRGLQMAIDTAGTLHFLWVPYAAQGVCYYRSLHAGILSSAEKVFSITGRSEPGIAAAPDGSVAVAGNAGDETTVAVYTRDGKGAWSEEDLPKPQDSLTRPNVSLSYTAAGKLLVTFRRSPEKYIVWQIRDGGRWSAEKTLPPFKYEAASLSFGEDLAVAAYDNQRHLRVIRFHPVAGGDYTALESAVNARSGMVRGEPPGLCRTLRGTLFASHSDQDAGPARDYEDKTVRAGTGFYYSTSRDDGKTWQTNVRATLDKAGQGHGNIAANGNWVMLVWPDIRGGALHLRYSLLHDGPPEP